MPTTKKPAAKKSASKSATGVVKRLSVKDLSKLKAGAAPCNGARNTLVPLTKMGQGECNGCTCTSDKIVATTTKKVGL